MNNRRTFLALSGITALYVLTGCSDSNTMYPGDGDNGGGGDTPPSAGTLPIPALLKGTDRGGIKHYDLNIVEAEHTFFEGIQTKTYAMNGTYLGPTLLLERGTDVSINYRNKLPVETTMHGHGMHLPGNMDGSAHQPIAVGGTWSAKYTVDQKACTNWYHPHYLHQTAPHVYQGLAGILLIEDSESRMLDLPKRYGIDDIPLVLQDRFFTADKKALDYSPSMMQLHDGYIGDTFITNGAIAPTFNAEAKELRLRLLNGSNSSIYNLKFRSGISFKQIASDNAFLESPVEMSQLTLSPGERAEIIVDLTDKMDERLTLVDYMYNKTFLSIDVNMAATDTTILPAVLTTLDPIPTATYSRPFILGMGMSGGKRTFTINGRTMDMDRIDAALSRGDVEEWEIINGTESNHNFHIHGTHFRVISRNDDPALVAENEKGYKDVVFLPGGESVKFIVEIPDDEVTADDNNPYMFHCHFLEHEDNGMMGQFTVS